jgi:hypothetical protein
LASKIQRLVSKIWILAALISILATHAWKLAAKTAIKIAKVAKKASFTALSEETGTRIPLLFRRYFNVSST